MDPITAIGLLASLSSLIAASNSVLTLMKSFRDGDSEFRELVNDVSFFTEALKGFNRILRSRQARHDVSPVVIGNALKEASDTIKDLEKRLFQISKCHVSTIRRMKWIQNKSSFKKLHDRIKDQSTLLRDFVQVVHTETSFAVFTQYLELVQSHNDRDEVDSDAISFQDSVFSESTAPSSRSSSVSVRRISIDSTPSSAGSSTSSNRRLSLDDSSRSPLIHIAGDSVRQDVWHKRGLEQSSELTLPIRQACRYDCYCQCHNLSPAALNKGFSKLIASQHRCTDSSCQKAILPNEKAVVSSTFFRKAISQVMSSKNIKIRYELNSYRMVSEGSNAMRYVKHGNLGKLKMCFKTGEATIWDTAPDGWSLLHTAAYNRQLPIVKYLLDLGASTEVADVGTRKPADLAILKSFAMDATSVEQEIVELFSKKDDYISDFEFTPIHIAVLEIYDSTDLERPTLEQLIQVVDDANNAPPGTDWTKWKMIYQRRSPLFGQIIEIFRASAHGKPKTHKVIHNLLDQKDRKYCWTPLHWACSTGRTEKMKILMEYGANPFILSNLDANILHAAAESKTLRGLVGGLEIWKRYPQQLNINQANRWGETPLHVAAWGSAECVKSLLQAGADRNVRQEDQQVPLHCAGLSARGDIRREVVSLLCGGEYEPHINTQDVDGRPPIFDFLDDPECIEVLLAHGAKLDILDNSGKSLFHHACIQNESGAIETILRLSPNSVMVTVKDHDGNTALVEALRHESLESAVILLQLDDVGDVVGRGGWTAAHYAVKIGDADVLEVILEHSSFVRGMKTIDGKTLEVVAMESGNWCGKVKELLRQYNTIM